MPAAPLTITPHDARRFQIRLLGLEHPHPTLAAALSHHGYIQIDPINVCGRMQDLILRPRVAGYREGDLMRHLHGDKDPLDATTRTAFEHHLPSSGILVALTLDAWPYLQTAMHARSRRPGPWSGRLSAREKELAPRLLSEIAQRGPLGSEAFDDPRRAKRFWGSATLVKSVLQKLFFHGQLLIAQRDKGRRRYDLPGRVLPAAFMNASRPDTAATARWEALLKLRQRRLVALRRAELACVEDLVRPLRIDDGPVVYCLRNDEAVLDEIRASPPAPVSVLHLLAPLDPLIYDRALTRRLWDYDYTWEVYTPPLKRVRGYYALPVLSGGQLVGHVDPKADRKSGRLVVVSRQVARGHAITPAVRGLASFLGLKS